MNRVTLLSDLLGTIARRSWRGDRATRETLSTDEIGSLCRRLVKSRGEATGVRMAAEILHAVRALDDDGSDAFFRILAKSFAPDEAALGEAARAYAEAPGPDTLRQLQSRAEPPRQELFRRLNLAPGGTGELVRLRERLLPLVRSDPGTFEPVDRDLRHLFASWFNRGFLVLKPIDWDASARLLERIIAYESVHAIDDWQALRERVAPVDRRCFAFFHPSIPDDPLIFVEVALTREIPSSIDAVLARDRDVIDPKDMQVATFYSISNCHKGLAGISFGSFLIKQVAEDLRETVPALRTFVTLSPAPGFSAWLDSLSDEARETLDEDEADALRVTGAPGWERDETRAPAAGDGLRKLAARYLLTAKRPDGEPVDPVARFHLGNGAELHRILHLGDRSGNGLARARGIMVNYLYDLPKVEERHEAYAGTAEIAASRPVTTLLPARIAQRPARDTDAWTAA